MQYPHRRNRDGSVDSICPRCIATIASSTCEADLRGPEARHICLAWRLAYFEPKAPLIRWFAGRVRRDRALA